MSFPTIRPEFVQTSLLPCADPPSLYAYPTRQILGMSYTEGKTYHQECNFEDDEPYIA